MARVRTIANARTSFVNGNPDFPDLNRLFTDCVWDADGRWHPPTPLPPAKIGLTFEATT